MSNAACGCGHGQFEHGMFGCLVGADDPGHGAACPCERTSREFVQALDLHKERIRRLQEALCECQQRDLFQADLHDEACPVYEIAADQRKEYEPHA